MVPQALLYVPGSPPRLLAGLRFRHDSNDTTRAAVYASFDHGETWEPADGGLAEEAPGVWRHRVFVEDLVIDPGDPNRLFMGLIHGVLRSLDGGQSWEFVLGDFDLLTNGFVDILIDPERNGRVWVAGEGFIFVPFVMITEDWGETWNGSAPRCGGIFYETPVSALALDPNVAERLFLGAQVGLFHSNEAGVPDSWDCAPQAPPAPVVGFATLYGVLYAATVTVDRNLEPPTGPEVSHLGLYRKTNQGTSWHPLSVPHGAPGATSTAADPDGGRILIGTRAGLWAVSP